MIGLLLVRGWDLAGASSPGPHYTGRLSGRPLCTTPAKAHEPPRLPAQETAVLRGFCAVNVGPEHQVALTHGDHGRVTTRPSGERTRVKCDMDRRHGIPRSVTRSKAPRRAGSGRDTPRHRGRM